MLNVRCKNHTSNPFTTWYLQKWKIIFNPGISIFQISIYLWMKSEWNSESNSNIQYICFSSTFKYMWSQTNQHVRKCENQVSPVNSLDLFWHGLTTLKVIIPHVGPNLLCSKFAYYAFGQCSKSYLLCSKLCPSPLQLCHSSYTVFLFLMTALA